jgi:hypothetical protein
VILAERSWQQAKGSPHSAAQVMERYFVKEKNHEHIDQFVASKHFDAARNDGGASDAGAGIGRSLNRPDIPEFDQTK